MKYKIGIFGSAVEGKKEINRLAFQLGRELGKYRNKIILITGASTGLPYIVSNEAAKQGVEIWEYTPETDLKSHREAYPKNDYKIYSQMFYVPKKYKNLFFLKKGENFKCDRIARLKYRNVISTANCDAGIIISGRWGTLNEFTNLVDMGKVIGVLTETGGIADELQVLNKKISKKTEAILIFEDSPGNLIAKIIDGLKK